MKTCWIHIGMHKTGTTSIQQNLAAVEEPQGWRYISVASGPNMGQAMYAMFATDPHKFHWFVKLGMSARKVAKRGAGLRAKFAQAITGCSENTVIVSAEALSNIDPGGVQALKDFLDPYFDEIRVIAYVRPPLGFMNSVYQQQLKHGKGTFKFNDSQPKYRRHFHKYDRVFGRDHVLLRKFDPASFPNGCIVGDFCRLVGIEGPPSESVRRVNESLSREACGILYAYRKFGPGYGTGRKVIQYNNRILDPLRAMRGAKFKLAETILAQSLNREDLQWMERRLGESLQEGLSDDPSAIKSEEELLTIQLASCLEFAEKFHEINGIRIPKSIIPTGDPVDPQKVAQMVECGHDLGRQMILEEQRKLECADSDGKSLFLKFPPTRMLLRWIEGRLTAGHDARNTPPPPRGGKNRSKAKGKRHSAR